MLALPDVKAMTIPQLHAEAMSRQMAMEDCQVYGEELDRQVAVVNELRSVRSDRLLIDELQKASRELEAASASVSRLTRDIAILRGWKLHK